MGDQSESQGRYKLLLLGYKCIFLLVMGRILLVLVLCGLALTWAEGQAENENMNAIKKDDIIANNVVVKREASAEAGKREGKNGRPHRKKKIKQKNQRKGTIKEKRP